MNITLQGQASVLETLMSWAPLVRPHLWLPLEPHKPKVYILFICIKFRNNTVSLNLNTVKWGHLYRKKKKIIIKDQSVVFLLPTRSTYHRSYQPSYRQWLQLIVSVCKRTEWGLKWTVVSSQPAGTAGKLWDKGHCRFQPRLHNQHLTRIQDKVSHLLSSCVGAARPGG